MKSISLWQPWASLVALEAKRIETRHWPAPEKLIGQRIAIYATKGRAKHDDGRLWSLAEEAACLSSAPFYAPLSALVSDPPAAFAGQPDGHAIQAALPRGVIVATAVLERCRPMDVDWIHALDQARPDEIDFGLYAPGRYAWVLRDVIRTRPVDLTGLKGTRQGIFDVPDELVIPAMTLEAVA